MKRTLISARLMGILLAVIMLAGCGAAGPTIVAPPVDLPAPTASRITIEGPDASGKATVTGLEGAVQPESIVFISNQTAANAATKAIEQSAFPSACDDPFSVCVFSPDGSFSAQIGASSGDVLAVALIDEDGTIGEAIVLGVPSSTCNADGSLMDLANAGGIPFILFEGDESTTSRLVKDETDLTLPLCSASAFSVFKGADGEQAIIASADERSIVMVDFSSEAPFVSSAVIVEGIPRALAHIGDSNRFAMVLQNESSFGVARMSSVTGTIDKWIDIPVPSGASLVRLDLLGEFNDGGYIGIVLFESFEGDEKRNLLSFFETSNFNDVTIDATPIDLASLLGKGTVTDVRLVITDLESGSVGLLMTEDEGAGLMIAQLRLAKSGETLTLNRPIAGIKSEEGLTLDPSSSDIGSPQDKKPKRFDVSYTETETIAYVLIEDIAGTHQLWQIVDFGGSPLEYVMGIEGSPSPAFVAVDSDSQSILIADDVLGTILDMSPQ